MGYCSVFFNRLQILVHHRAWVALSSTCKSTCLPACNQRQRRGLQSFPRLSQGEYKGRSVRSPPASHARSLWTGRPCQQLPAPSRHTALHVPTGSDRVGADRSTQHQLLMHAHLYPNPTHIHARIWPCPICQDRAWPNAWEMLQACTLKTGWEKGMGHCLYFCLEPRCSYTQRDWTKSNYCNDHNTTKNIRSIQHPCAQLCPIILGTE